MIASRSHIQRFRSKRLHLRMIAHRRRHDRLVNGRQRRSGAPYDFIHSPSGCVQPTSSINLSVALQLEQPVPSTFKFDMRSSSVPQARKGQDGVHEAARVRRAGRPSSRASRVRARRNVAGGTPPSEKARRIDSAHPGQSRCHRISVVLRVDQKPNRHLEERRADVRRPVGPRRARLPARRRTVHPLSLIHI